MIEDAGGEDVIPPAATEVSDEVLGLDVGGHGRRQLEVLRAVAGVFAGAVRAVDLVLCADRFVNAQAVGCVGQRA